MFGQVSFEVTNEVGDDYPARLRIRRHHKALVRATIKGTVGYFVCVTVA
jgi:hypothetical protein